MLDQGTKQIDDILRQTFSNQHSDQFNSN